LINARSVPTLIFTHLSIAYDRSVTCFIGTLESQRASMQRSYSIME
jgi:hypothetical protein